MGITERAGRTRKWNAGAAHRLVMIGIVSLLVVGTFSVSGMPAVAGISRNALPLVVQTESPSPTPSPSPSTTYDPDFRSVDLSASRRRVHLGRRVVFTGRVRANRPDCAVAKPVTLRRLIFGTSRHLPIATKTTDRNGEFRFSDRARWSSAYTAVAQRKGRCRREVSDPVVVKVSVRLGVRVVDRTPERFTNFRIYGRIRPSHPHTDVVLQRKARRQWVTVRRQELSRQSSYSFFPLASWRGKREYRIKWPKADRDHETGRSRSITIRTT